MYITASKLYDFIQCPHKVWRDIYGPQEEKIDEKLNKLELVKSYCEKEIFSFELSYKKNPYEKLPADMS